MSELNKGRCCDNCLSFMEVPEEFREQYQCDGYCMFRVSLSESKELDDQFKRMRGDTCREWVAASRCEILRLEVTE